MDEKTRREIFACGTCGQTEEAHKNPVGTDPSELALFAAMGGACPKFTVSDRALQYQAHLALAGRDPQPRYGGPRPKRLPLCGRCGYRHPGKDCVLSPGPAGTPPPRDPQT